MEQRTGVNRPERAFESRHSPTEGAIKGTGKMYIQDKNDMS